MPISRGALPRINANARPSNAPGKSDAPTLPRGCVQIYCADPPRSVIALLGPDPIKQTGGGGGWETVARPHQTAMTIWGGGAPYAVALPLMLDDYHENGTVEDAVALINRLARGDDDSEPGVVEIGGVQLPADRWVIDSVDWGDPIRADDDLRTLRQPVTLALLEHVPPSYLQPGRRARDNPKRKTRVVVVKKGDTPAKIARRCKCKWTDLRTLNKGIVKTANQKEAAKGDKFKAGMKLRAPVAQPAKKHAGKPARGHARAH
jgi:hypothetical protein